VKTILTLALVLGAVYTLLVLFYAWKQRDLIYYPTGIPEAQARQEAEALGGRPWLSPEGEWLGWRIDTAGATQGQARRAVVFHGNAGMALNRGYYAQLLAGFTRSGPWAVHVFEYPGYGPRDGDPSEAAFVTAAVQAVDDLLHDHPEPLLIIGESIGSGVASSVVHQRPDAVAALMLITPFDSMANVAGHHMPWLPVRALMRDRYDNLAALRDYGGAMIVITAGEDRIVPASFAQPLLDQHAGPLLHETQTSAGHNSLHFQANQAPWPEVDAFLASP